MKTKLQPKILLLVCTLLFFVFQTKSFAGPSNFTWTGTTSTSWTTATNWSPNGVPSTSDTVTIVSGTRDVSLSGNITVKKFTITSGTVYLNDFTLTITTHATFTSGTITAGAGRLVVSSATSTTFSGTTFSVPTTITTNSVYLNGSTFNDSLTITKNGNSNDNSKGGNLYKKQFLLTNSAKGAFVLSDSFPDTYEKKLIIKNTNEGTVYLAHRASGTVFKDDVTFYGKNIYSNYYGTAEYQGNIILNCPAGNVYFGYGSGSSTLANTKRLQLGDSAFAAGKLTLMHFTKLGTDGEINLTLTGSAILTFESGTVINSTIAISSPTLYLHGARFNNLADMTVTGTSTASSEGGCYFAADAKITNNSSGTNSFALGNTVPDTFATTSTITNTKGTVSMNNAVFVGNTILKNVETSTNSDRFIIASTGNCVFQGNIQIQNSVSGFCFGKTSGTASLASGKTLSFVSGFTGNLTLKNFTQQGSTAQSFSFTSTGQKLFLGPGSTFNGNFDFSGHFIILNGTTFNGTATINRYGAVPDTCAGGNVFNSTTIIKDSTNAAYSYLMAYTNADDYNGDVTFIQKGSGAILYPCYNKNSTFAGNITVNSNSAFQFGVNGGKVILDGTTNQNLSNLSSYPVTMKKLQINKSANSFTLNFPLTVSDSLILTQGRINTDTINLLSISNAGKLSGGSDNSYINGPMKKTGNSTFVFPLGSSSLTHPYHPLEISTPASTSDAYTANYFSTSQTIGSAIDTSIDNLNACQYWKLNRNTGSSKVKVKLSWNNDSCETISPSNFRVTGWNGSMWKDLGNASTSGDSIQGTVQSLDSLNTISVVTLAFKKCIAFKSIIISKPISCAGRADGSIQVTLKKGTPPYSYFWSPYSGDKSNYSNLDIGRYIIVSSDSKFCELRDTAYVTITDSLNATFIIEPSDCSNSTGSITAAPSGGVGGYEYYWTSLMSSDSAVSSLPSGLYPVIIKDSLGCSIFLTAKISDRNSISGSIDQILAIQCSGLRTAALEFNPTSGTLPFTYKWDRFDSDTLSMIHNLGKGKINLQVSDDNNCKSFFDFEISQPQDISIGFQVANSQCGLNTGSVVASVTGGERPYNYLWSSAGVDSIESDLHSGYDTLFITDNKGCRNYGVAEIFDEDGPVITPHVLSEATCYKTRNGSAWIEVEGAVGEKHFTYWPKNFDNDTIFDIIADDYSVIVQDSLGCRQKANFTISGYEPIDISVVKFNSSSDSIPDGKAFAIVEGGCAPYQYLWSNSSIVDSAIELTAGLYSLIITDHWGCQDSSIFRIRRDLTPLCSQFTCQNTPLPSTCPPISITCPSPCFYISIDIVSDFYADNTGTVSSECAFESAASFLQSLDADVVKLLTIPFGIYIVGRQENTPGYYLYGNSVLCFQGINNLTIQGEIVGTDTTTLIFENCMKMGSFDYPSCPEDRYLTCNDASLCWVDAAGINYSKVATIGQMIHLSECKNITIRNLKLDGNIENMKIGGFWPNGMPYDGIFLNGCFNFTIESVIAQNFGHDGIWINHRLCQYPQISPPLIPNFASTHGLINNVKSTNNCRNGLTWAGGSGLIVSNSEFSWSGMGRYALQPAAGIDIEYENSNFANSNGSFYNVVCKYNKNHGLIDDANNSTSQSTYFNHDHDFYNCTFISSGEGSITVRPFTYGMHFMNQSKFYGHTNFGYPNLRFFLGINNDGSIYNPITRSLSFENCYFFEEYSDPDILPVTTKSFGFSADEAMGCPISTHMPIIDYTVSMGVRFINTEITTNFTMKWLWISGMVAVPNQRAWNILDNVTFRNYGLNACACDHNIASFNSCNFKSPCPLNGTVTLNNEPLGVGCPEPGWSSGRVVRNTFAANSVINPGNIWGDQQFYPVCVYPTYSLPTAPPVVKFIAPSVPNLITSFSYCGGCSGPTDDCITCSSTEPITYPLCVSPSFARTAKFKEEILKLSLSPIPAYSSLNVANLDGKVKLEIINMFGIVLMYKSSSTSEINFDIENLPPGTYFLRTNEISYYKFIKL